MGKHAPGHVRTRECRVNRGQKETISTGGRARCFYSTRRRTRAARRLPAARAGTRCDRHERRVSVTDAWNRKAFFLSLPPRFERLNSKTVRVTSDRSQGTDRCGSPYPLAPLGGLRPIATHALPAELPGFVRARFQTKIYRTPCILFNRMNFKDMKFPTIQNDTNFVFQRQSSCLTPHRSGKCREYRPIRSPKTVVSAHSSTKLGVCTIIALW